MRILLVAPSRRDPAHRRVLGALVRELARAGDEVRTFPPADGLRPEESRRRLERLLREAAPDVCHIQYFSRGLGYLGGVRWPAAAKLVLTHQGAAVKLLERFPVFRRLAERADAVTAVSRQGLEELRRALPRAAGKALCIPNGAAAAAGPSRSPAAAGRRPFVLTVGRQAAYKGSDVLLMAFAGLAAERPDLDLVICGPDQTGGRLARFRRKLGLDRRVRLLGVAGPARVSRLMRDCLFFVLPSRHENMPMALLEAMAAGKASAASAVGGVAEAVEHGVSGLVVAPGDAAALARAMSLLARDAVLRRRLGLGARARARLFGWPVVVARYRGLYAALLSGDGLPGGPAQEFERLA